MRLKRVDSNEHGIFSILMDNHNNVFATLEHAYAQSDNTYKPKIPNGTFKCIRGQHQLHSGPPFSTFEITGVVGHSNLLFHKGNTDKDSEGCVLVGSQRIANTVVASRVAFELFMDCLDGINEFTLTVE